MTSPDLGDLHPVTKEAILLYRVCREPVARAQESVCRLPIRSLEMLWYLPEKRAFVVDIDPSCGIWEGEDRQSVLEACRGALAPSPVYDSLDEPAMKFAGVAVPALMGLARLEKRATDPVTRTLGKMILMFPSSVSKYIPGAGSPIAVLLAGGLLGAGAGYGLGRFGEWLLPEKWQRGRLRRTSTILGGLAGAVPGLLGVVATLTRPGSTAKDLFKPGPLYTEAVANEPIGYVKSGEESATGLEGDLPSARLSIPVNPFVRTVMLDPRVADRMDPAQQAALVGLVETAAYNAGGNAKASRIGPADIARVAAGMGSGYLSGWLAGKALGILAGAPKETQDWMKNVGLWAGAALSVLPRVYGLAF